MRLLRDLSAQPRLPGRRAVEEVAFESAEEVLPLSKTGTTVATAILEEAQAPILFTEVR